METSETEILYFLEVNGEKRGPFRLSGLIDAGMQPDSMIWWEGLESWARAGKIPKFAALLKDDRRERLAAQRAARLPEPGPIRSLRSLGLVTNGLAALFCLVGSTALWTALVIWFIVQSSSGRPAARPSEGLEMVGVALAIVGLLGSGFGLSTFIAESIFIRRLVAQCKEVVWAAAPSHRDTDVSEELPSWDEVLTGLVEGFERKPIWRPSELDQAAIEAGAGEEGPRTLIGLVMSLAVILAFGAIAPILLCLIAPHLAMPLIGLLVLLLIYAAVHVAVVFSLFTTIRSAGTGLKAVIIRYELKIPSAPAGLAAWTAICGMLMLAGPFGLVFFGLLAFWILQTSSTAALICRHDARQQIAEPLPEKIVEKPKPAAWLTPFGD